MTKFRFMLAGCCCLPLAACGTYIPSQRDWPDNGSGAVERMNAALVRSIVCELSYAVTLTILEDLHESQDRPGHRSYSEFLSNWGVEVATDLTVSENSTINPSGLWAPNWPGSTVFNLAGGVNAGATSTNENQYNIFYPLSALYKPNLFQRNSKERPCRDPSGDKEGSPLVDIDLRILPLLESRVQTVQLGIADDPGKSASIYGAKNVLTQTVSIRETITGNVTPSWKFTAGAVDSSSTLFSAGRTRTHQIVFTFGPLAKGKNALTQLAESFHLNEQLKAGLRRP